MCDAEVKIPTATIRERGREENFIFLSDLRVVFDRAQEISPLILSWADRT
jgi:hypothetical protein